MNNDTIKAAAQEILTKHLKACRDNDNWIGGTCKLNEQKTYLPEIEAMIEFSAQKDEQIKELVEALEYAINIDKVSYHNLSVGTIDLFRQLIQKYKA